ncbi:integrase, catalytic region, zinc finger, CCHC-type containing protein [Tanacetum coccineum]
MAPERRPTVNWNPPVNHSTNQNNVDINSGIDTQMLNQLIATRVAEALAAAAVTHAASTQEENNIGSNSSQNKTCNYKEFCLVMHENFCGTEGAIGLTRWFEKLESQFGISNVAEGYKVKFASSTLLDGALTWWNVYVHSVTLDTAHATPWSDFKAMFIRKNKAKDCRAPPRPGPNQKGPGSHGGAGKVMSLVLDVVRRDITKTNVQTMGIKAVGIKFEATHKTIRTIKGRINICMILGKSRMEAIHDDRQRGTNDPESVENGKQILILQGLTPEVIALGSNHKVAKELWERIQLLMQGTSLTKQERECLLRTTREFHANMKSFNTLNAISDPLALVAIPSDNPQSPYQLKKNSPSINSYQNSQFQPQVSLYQSPQHGSPYQSQQYSKNHPSTPFLITYPSNDYQSSVYHNVYSPSSSIPQLEYVPIVNQQPEFPQLDSGLIVLVFQKGDDPIDAINHMMSFLTAVVTSRYHTTNNQLRNSLNLRQQATINDGRVILQPIQGRQTSFAVGTTRTYTPGASRSNFRKQRTFICYNCKGEGHMSKQCTKPKRKWDDSWFKDKVLLSVEISDLNASLQEKVLVITALKDDLRKLKGKALVDNAVTKHTIDPETLKIEIAVRKQLRDVAIRMFTQNVPILRLRHDPYTPFELITEYLRLIIFPMYLVHSAIRQMIVDELGDPHFMKGTLLTIVSGTVPNPPPSTPFVPPSRTDWDLLFQSLFDELLTPPSSVDCPASKVIALIAEVAAPEPATSIGLPSSTNVDQNAPLPSNLQTTPETLSPIISNDVEEENHELDVAHMNNDSFFSIPILENHFEESSSSNIIPIVVQTAAPNSEHNYKDVLTQACCIKAIQEKLNEFEHLEVWELVPRLDKVMVITLKWIYKVKLDELGGILKNKDCLVARGYHQKEGIDSDPVARLDAI